MAKKNNQLDSFSQSFYDAQAKTNPQKSYTQNTGRAYTSDSFTNDFYEAQRIQQEQRQLAQQEASNRFGDWRNRATDIITRSKNSKNIYRSMEESQERMKSTRQLMQEAAEMYQHLNTENQASLWMNYQKLRNAMDQTAQQEADFSRYRNEDGSQNQKAWADREAARLRQENLDADAKTQEKWEGIWDSLTDQQRRAVNGYNKLEQILGFYAAPENKEPTEYLLGQYGEEGIRMLQKARDRKGNRERTEKAIAAGQNLVDKHGALATLVGAAATIPNDFLSLAGYPIQALDNVFGRDDYKTSDPNNIFNTINAFKSSISSERDLQVQGKPTAKNLADIEDARENGTIEPKQPEEIINMVNDNPLLAYLSMPEEDKKELEQWWADIESGAAYEDDYPESALEKKYTTWAVRGEDALEKMYLASHDYSPSLMNGGLFQKGASFLHSAASSALDSMAGGFALGEAHAIGMGASAALQSSSDYAKEGIEKGVRSEAAALANGAIESWTEGKTVSRLENAMFGAGEDILTAAKGEGFEEGLGDVLKLAAERLILGNDSEYSRNIQDKMAQGESWNQARRDARLDFVKDTIYDTAVGAASGAMGQMAGRALQVSNRQTRPIIDQMRDQARGLYTGGHDNTYMTTNLPEGASVSTVMQTGDVDANEYIRKAVADRGLLTKTDIQEILADSTTTNAILQKAGMDTEGFAGMTESAQMDTVRGAVNRISNWVYQLQGKQTQSRYQRQQEADTDALTRMRDSGNATVNALIEKAMNGKVSNKDVTSIINDPVALSALRTVADVKGVERMNTMSAKRIAVKRAITQLANQVKTEQERRKAVTDRDNQVQEYVSGRTMTQDTAEELYGGPQLNLEGKAIWQDESGVSHDSTVKGFAMDGGKIIVEMADGSRVDAQQVSYGSDAETIVYRRVAEIAPNARIANLLISNYQNFAKGSITDATMAAKYANAIAGAYDYGKRGLSFRAFMNTKLAGGFANQQLEQAWRSGNIMGKDTAQAKQAEVQSQRETLENRQNKENDGKVFVGEKEVREADVDGLNLSESQKATVHAATVLAQATGVQYHFVHSEVQNGKRGFVLNGKFRNINGAYLWAQNEIWVDLEAGSGKENLPMFTMAHETTHFIAQWSPVQFRKLQRFLFDRMYESRGVDANDLIEAKRKELADKDGNLASRELATEEVMADAMQTMFTDTNALEHINALRTENESLWRKIRDHVFEIADKFRRAAAGLSPEGPEANIVRGMTRDMETLENLFSYGVADAARNATAAVTTENGQKNNASQEEGVKYSPRMEIRESDESRYEKLKDSTISVPDFRAIAEKTGITITEEELDTLKHIRGDDAKPILKALGNRFAAFKKYVNQDASIDMTFSVTSMNESVEKIERTEYREGKRKKAPSDYRNFAKLLGIFDHVISGSVEIEEHENRYANKGKNVKATHVLFGAFEADTLVPVKIEVREFNDGNTQNKLYVAVTLSPVPADVWAEYKKNSDHSAHHLSETDTAHAHYAVPTYSLPNIVQLVNSKDGEILKYFPHQMLDAEQFASKEAALESEREYIDRKDQGEKLQERKVLSDMGAKEYNRTVVLDESTVDKYLQDYAAKSSPNYAQAYIVKMSPRDFMNLTTSTIGRINIQQEAKPLDAEKMGEASRHQPIQLHIDTETGEVVGHEGRHRMEALRRAGIGNVPVLIFDSSNKYSKQPIDTLTLTGQDFGNSRSEASVDARFLLPLSYANRDEVIRRFSTVPSLEAMQTKYNGKETVRFQGRKAVEETKDLIAVHNLEERNVEAALNLGGLPSPSIAIVKAEAGHTKYGRISFVFGKGSIDPQADSRNRVYGSDAWTPVNPKVDYKPTEQAESKFNSLYYDIYRKFGGTVAKPMYRYSNELEDILSSNGGEQGLIEKHLDDTAMMNFYLAATTGEPVKDVYKTVSVPVSEYDSKLGELMVQSMGDRPFREFSSENVEDWLKQYGDEFRENYKRFLMEYRGRTDQQAENMLNRRPMGMNAAVATAKIMRFLSGTEETRQEFDSEATNNAIIDAAIGDDASGYMNWLQDLFTGITEKKGIYNGKDVITRSGNRRSWDQLHDDYTLENIVNAMNTVQKDRGQGIFGASASALNAVASPEYKDIASVKKDSGRLGKVSEEQMKAVTDELDGRIDQLLHDISDETGGQRMYLSDALVNAATARRTVAGIQSSFKKDGYTISKSLAERAVAILNDAGTLPTEYFESKPQRAVGFDEVLAAVVPSDTSPSLISRLAQQGVPVVTYEAGNETDRLAKLNSIEGAKFQQRKEVNAKAVQTLEERNARLEEDLARARELAKMQGQITGGKKMKRSSVEAEARLLKKQFDCGGDTQTLADLLQTCYEQIAGDEELSMSKVREYAAPVTEWLQKNARDRLDPFADDILSQLRGRKITLTETQKQEAISQYGSMQDFRRALAGSGIRIVNDGAKLDTIWGELNELSPMLFAEDVTEGDMVTTLAGAVDTPRDMRMDVSYGMGQAFWDQEAFEQVYEGYWGVSTLNTVADRYQKKLTQMQLDFEHKIEGIRDENKRKLEEQKYRQMVAEYERTEAKADKAEAKLARETLKLKAKHTEAMDQVQHLRRQLDLERTFARDQRKQMREDYSKRIAEKTQALREGYQQSREKAVESRNKTALRHSIQKSVKRLNDLLLTDTAARHVPDSLKKVVAESLYIVNMDTTDTDARLEKLRHDMVEASAKGNVKRVQEIAKSIANLEAAGERMDEKLSALKTAYGSIMDAPNLANYYDEGISSLMQQCIDEVGDTPLRNMTMEQLSTVKDLYTAVRHTVSEANHVFVEGKKVATEQAAKSVMGEVNAQRKRFGAHTAAGDTAIGLSWANLKPVYAFKRMGSKTMMNLFQNVRKGQDTWYRDVAAANAFLREQTKTFGQKNWDMDQAHTFTSSSGETFQLSLNQIMSLYAYAKREASRDHIRSGGIVLRGDAEKVIKKVGKLEIKGTEMDSNAYKISDETLGTIIGTLTKEQRGYVDAMQEYLSEVMGEKGNEVSRELYGIRLFKEENYFPLRSAPEYMARARESQQKEQVNPKLKNKGFTKSTVKHARNPIVVDNFLDVWSDHVNEMSMYHAFVLPLEAIGKVYNWHDYGEEGQAAESVNATLKKAFGNGATGYIENLLNDLNGGARSDPNVGLINKTTGLFKKGATFMSMSVVIQQPSAIMRATAMIDPKYFIGPRVTAGKHSEIWNELKEHAAVAGIKEMGYFDVGLGRSTRDFIQQTDLTTWAEKRDALIHDSNYRDEILGKAPALADEVAWCGIWNAVKREQKALHPGMAVNSQQFLDLCGERFSEVIDYTQVYDSVLTRSQLMRSKDTGVKMATSFMAEPTVNANMLMSALDDFRSGKRVLAAKQVGGVVTAAILNSILVSFVYAARDKDDDKEYWEKYLGQFVGNVKDSLNPLSMIPFGRDIMSIWQGYSVERSDMAIVSDFIEAWQKLFDDKTAPLTKVEKFAGAVGNIAGLPIRNITRDAHGIYNMVVDAFDGNHSTVSGAWNAVKGELPFMKADAHGTAMYKALLSGDQEYYKRMRQTYKDDAAANTALRKALRENDSRVHEAAVARNNGDTERYMQLAREIIKEGHFSQDEVVKAINAEMNELNKGEEKEKSSKAVSMYKSEELAAAIISGNSSMEQAITEELVRVKMADGMTEKKARESVDSSAKSAVKDAYLDGNLSDGQAERILKDRFDMEPEDASKTLVQWQFQAQYNYAWSDRKDAYFDGAISESAMIDWLEKSGKSREDAKTVVEQYNWERKYPDLDATEAQVRAYQEIGTEVGMEPQAFVEAWRTMQGIKSDYKENGKAVSGSKMKKVFAYIDTLPLTPDQKTALAIGYGSYSINNVYKYAPWA